MEGGSYVLTHRNLRKWPWGRYDGPGTGNLRGIRNDPPRQQDSLFSSLRLMGNTSAFTAPAASAWAVITFGWRLPPISLTGANTNASPAPDRGCGTPDASEQEPLPSARTEVGWRSTTAPAKTTATASVPSSSTWIIHPGACSNEERSWNLWRNTNARLRECRVHQWSPARRDKLTITEPPTP